MKTKSEFLEFLALTVNLTYYICLFILFIIVCTVCSVYVRVHVIYLMRAV